MAYSFMLERSKRRLVLSAFLLVVICVQSAQVRAEEESGAVVDIRDEDPPDNSRGLYGVVGLIVVSLFYVSIEGIVTGLRRKKR
jgi:hypothetical protein